MRFSRIAFGVAAAGFSAHAFADTSTLGFTSLPTAQSGWTYYDTYGNEPEGSTFSLTGGPPTTTLHFVGTRAGAAVFRDPVAAFQYFDIEATARVTSDSGVDSYGMTWYFSNGHNQQEAVSIEPTGVYVNNALAYSLDATQYHAYEFYGSTISGSAAWTLLVDGASVATGTSYVATSETTAINFGDASSGSAATGDWTAFSFTTANAPIATPEPGTIVLLAGAGLIARRTRRRA